MSLAPRRDVPVRCELRHHGLLRACLEPESGILARLFPRASALAIEQA
jgi:hypothetical protein